MPTLNLTEEQIADLVGRRHATTDIEFPPAGLQPYHTWLIRTLHRLAESSLGALRVDRSSEADTAVRIAPGRASITGVPLSLDSTTVDLAVFNNSTAYVWLEDSAGQAAIGTGDSVSDWPATPHLKLAEVELAAGQVTSVLDRRLEAVFRV